MLPFRQLFRPARNGTGLAGRHGAGAAFAWCLAGQPRPRNWEESLQGRAAPIRATRPAPRRCTCAQGDTGHSVTAMLAGNVHGWPAWRPPQAQRGAVPGPEKGRGRHGRPACGASEHGPSDGHGCADPGGSPGRTDHPGHELGPPRLPPTSPGPACTAAANGTGRPGACAPPPGRGRAPVVDAPWREPGRKNCPLRCALR